MAGEQFLTYPLRDDRCSCSVNLSRRRFVGSARLLPNFWPLVARRVQRGARTGQDKTVAGERFLTCPLRDDSRFVRNCLRGDLSVRLPCHSPRATGPDGVVT